MKPLLRDVSLVIGIASVVVFCSLGGPKLWDRDEPRNAGCAYEMLTRGNWVVPMFNDQLRTHKPVLLYWLIMSAYAVFGVNEFAARFWSAVFAVGTVVSTYFLSKRLMGRGVGVWSAVALSTMLMFDVAARAATPDSVLIFPCTLAILLYVFGTFAPYDEHGGTRLRKPGVYFPTSWWVVAAMYAAMGVAILAKGPVGLVLPTAVIGMFLLIKRLPVKRQIIVPAKGNGHGRARWFLALVAMCLRPFLPWHFLKTCWTMRPFTALAVALAVALPWYLWVGDRTDGQWLRGFFLTHNLGRALTPMEDHAGSVLFYPIALLIGSFPWSVFAAPIVIDLVRRLRRSDDDRDGLLFALCWIGVYLGLFSIVRTELPSYITPCYPAVAMLVGGFIDRWLTRRHLAGDVWPYLALGTFTFVGIVLVIALPIAASRFLHGEQCLGIVVGVIPAVGGAVAVALLRRDCRRMAAVSFAAAAMLFSLSLFALSATRVGRYQPSEQLVQVEADLPDVRFAAIGALEPSLVFYAKQPVSQLRATEDVAKFLHSGQSRYLITNDQTYTAIKTELPDSTRVVRRLPQFLKSGELLLIGRGNARTASRVEKTRDSL